MERSKWVDHGQTPVSSFSCNKILQFSLCKYSLLSTCCLIPQRSLTLVKCLDLQDTNIEVWQKKKDIHFFANRSYWQQESTGWMTLCDPNLITFDFFYCQVVRVHLFSISYYHRKANIFINKSKGQTICLWKKVLWLPFYIWAEIIS